MDMMFGIEAKPRWRNVDPRWTLTPYIKEHLDGAVKRQEILPTTARSKSYMLWQFAESFGRRPLNQLNQRAIERWQEDAPKGTPSTRRLRLSYVRVFCQWMVDNGHIKANPTKGIKRISVPDSPPKTMQHDEVARLLDHVRQDKRATAILWMMVGLGLRCVDVVHCNVEGYDRGRKMLRFVTKFGGEREVPVTPEAARAIDAYLDEAGWQSGPLIRRCYSVKYVFGYTNAKHHGRMSPITLSIYVREWMKGAGVKHVKLDGRSAHGLRRTAATDVIDVHHDIRYVKEMLGHKKLATSERYIARVDKDVLREAMSGRTYQLDAVAGD